MDQERCDCCGCRFGEDDGYECSYCNNLVCKDCIDDDWMCEECQNKKE